MNQKHQFVAQVCHIAAASPGGERYDPAMTDEERRSYGNLILLCYGHHIETNEVVEYDATTLRQMKADHEARFKDLPYEPSEEVVAVLSREAEEYWQEVRRRNLDESHYPEDIRMEVDVEADVTSLFASIRESLAGLNNLHDCLRRSAELLPQDVRATIESLGYDLQSWDELPYWQNPTAHRNWTELEIGLCNFMTRITVVVDQLEVKHLETALALSPSSLELRGRLEDLRRHVLGYVARLGYVD